ncbi:ankyrin repeat domain-containing protein [Azorhizobium doebereinerae]|uniref:ankyrin repeat domain-containing protein n=1 Tax=Azorhizobium doebereinerae TaxID=281091 RepID=UPI00048AA476|nr:ankyrin repeat domain-containing protein [Azorhizobium doebereinerae]
MLIFDTRDPDAYARARMAGAVRLSQINLSEVITGTPKHRPVLIYCYHGNASQEYAQTFSDFGFCDVSSLDGGYEGWRLRHEVLATPPLDPDLSAWLAAHGFPPDDVDGVIANLTTPLMTAAHVGDVEAVCQLLAAGADMNARNADGNTALWLACVGRHLEVIDLLVAAGTDIDNQNDNGATALMYAASAGLAGVVARLLARGADMRAQTLDGFSALDLAGTLECLALLRPAREVVAG